MICPFCRITTVNTISCDHTYGTNGELSTFISTSGPGCSLSGIGSDESGVETPFVVVPRALAFAFEFDFDFDFDFVLPTVVTTLVFTSLFLAILMLFTLRLGVKDAWMLA
jgi:hypothetical protein